MAIVLQSNGRALFNFQMFGPERLLGAIVGVVAPSLSHEERESLSSESLSMTTRACHVRPNVVACKATIRILQSPQRAPHSNGHDMVERCRRETPSPGDAVGGNRVAAAAAAEGVKADTMHR